MTTLTIKSRNGETFEFFVADSGGYVTLNGSQICHGGKSLGNTISCDGSIESLKSVARKWYRAYKRFQSNF